MMVKSFEVGQASLLRLLLTLKATSHFMTISMRGQDATGKIQRTNYHDGSCGPSLTGKTLSMSLIFTLGMAKIIE